MAIKQAKMEDLPVKHVNEHENFEYYRHKFLGYGATSQCVASIYQVPPGKSAYPYHYHVKNEEIFYIISGQGILKTPDGVRTATAGDLLFFPADESGAHKLTNSSETEMLVYLDVDTTNPLDVAFYPDSKKIGVWGCNINQVYCEDSAVDYYDGE